MAKYHVPKLYTPRDMEAALEAVKKVDPSIDATKLVIALHKIGFRIVEVRP